MSDETITMTKRQTAVELAKSHYAVEPNLKRVVIVEPIREDDPNEPIVLLEVVEGTIERGIEPIYFMSDRKRGIEYPSVIVEVSPREYEEIRGGELRIDLQSRGWSLGQEVGQN